MTKTVYVDVDGTLTLHDVRNSVEVAGPNQSVVDKVKRLAAEGCQVVVWSARGAEYARKAAAAFGIPAVACLGKPHLIVDDYPERMSNRWKRRTVGVGEFLGDCEP